MDSSSTSLDNIMLTSDGSNKLDSDVLVALVEHQPRFADRKEFSTGKERLR